MHNHLHHSVSINPAKAVFSQTGSSQKATSSPDPTRINLSKNIPFMAPIKKISKTKRDSKKHPHSLTTHTYLSTLSSRGRRGLALAFFVGLTNFVVLDHVEMKPVPFFAPLTSERLRRVVAVIALMISHCHRIGDPFWAALLRAMLQPVLSVIFYKTIAKGAIVFHNY